VNLFLSDVTKLKVLNLSSIDGGVLFAKALANGIKKNHLPELQMLDISNNAIGREGSEKLLFALDSMNCSSLTELNVAVNGLTEEGVNLLCVSIRKGTFVNLSKLDLSANNGNAALAHLATVLKQDFCPALRRLRLGKNTPEQGGLPPIFRKDFVSYIKLEY